MTNQRGPNRNDTEYIEHYESTPEKYIIKPNLLVLVNFYTVRVYFSIPLNETPNLFDTTTYQLTGPFGVISITSVGRMKHKKIDLTITGLTGTGWYTVSIIKEIEGINEVPIVLHRATAQVRAYFYIYAGPQLTAVTMFSGQDIDAEYDVPMGLAGLDTPANYTISSYPAALNWIGTAVSVTTSYFQFSTNRDMTFDPNLIDTTKYVIAPALAIRFIQIIDSRTLLFYPTDYMKNGETYEITVSNDVIDIDGQTIDPLAAKPTFTGLATLPQVVSATLIDPITLDIAYDKTMEEITAETATNYSIASGIIVITVSAAVLQTDKQTVRLTISPALAILFTVTVSNVVDTGGNALDPAHKTATFTGTINYPQVASASSIDYQTLRVIFDSEMSHVGLNTPGNYTFTCPGILTLTTNTATIIDNYTVELTVNEEMLTGVANYTVIANGALENTWGFALDPVHKTATFNGVGVAPQVSSAAKDDSTHINVVFDSTVETTSAETAGNYVVSGPSSPNVTAAVKQIDGVTVKLTLSSALITGDYTVTVSNVTDLVGNVVDPAHNQGTFFVAAPVWLQKTPGGVIPAALYQHHMAFHSGANLSCMGIGNVSGGFVNNFYVYSHAANTWTAKASAGAGHSSAGGYMVYDSSANRILFMTGGDWAGENWWYSYNYATNSWTFILPAHIPSSWAGALRGFAMAYDAHRNRTVFFGGVDRLSSRFNQTWEWNGTDWSQISPVTSPTTRSFAKMVYDSNRQVCVLVGGERGGGVYCDDTWEWDGTNWTQLAPATTNPTARSRHCLAFDSARNIIVLATGYNGARMGTMYEFYYDTGTGICDWSLVSPPSSPSARYGSTMVYDSSANKCILYGGYDTGYLGDTWTYYLA